MCFDHDKWYQKADVRLLDVPGTKVLDISPNYFVLKNCDVINQNKYGSMKTRAIHLGLLYKLCEINNDTETNPADANAGALISPNTNPNKTPIHTRAAEAVFPLSVAYKHSQKIKYLESAVRLDSWLIRNQKFDGSWKETPWRWKGTTADQCLAMADAYSILKNQLSLKKQAKWEIHPKGGLLDQ
jgi:hypothetical protein